MNYGFRVTDKGFVVHPRPYRQNAGNALVFEVLVPDEDPLDTNDVNALVFRWHESFHIAAIDPWPRVRVRWAGGDVELSPRTMLGMLSPLRFEQETERALVEIHRRAPTKVDLGWIEIPVLEWERVSALPVLAEDESARGRGGAYRAGGPNAEETAVAARGAPTSIELMLDWLASTPDRTWKDHPRQVRLTEDAIYIERRGGELLRLPLEALRHREGPVYDDAVYVFGRRTRLVLPHRKEGCAVRERLDAWLDGERPAP